MPGTFDRIVLSCEHASAAVPRAYARLFASERARAALRTHRGSDLGALAVSRVLAKALEAPLRAGRATRLLVDLNRSPHGRTVWSTWSRVLDDAAREQVMRRHYHPYRDAVTGALEAAISDGRRVLHVSVHSFTPKLHGQVRRADVGLLYDPAMLRERALAARLAARLAALDSALRVRRNYPYRGVSDALVTWLRRRLDARRYVGIELELNQALLARPATARRVAVLLAAALAPERAPIVGWADRPAGSARPIPNGRRT